MSKLVRAIKFADIFDSDLGVGSDVNGRILVTVPYMWQKDGHMLKGFCGRGDDLESALSDFLSKCSGVFVCEKPGCARKEQAVVAI